MTNYNTITTSVLPRDGSTPTISRSTIANSSLTSLTTTDTISRSDIRGTIFGNLSDTPPHPRTRVTRSTITDSQVASSVVRRSTVQRSQLSVATVKRSTVISGDIVQSSLSRSTVNGGEIDSSTLSRSTAQGAQIKRSQMARSTAVSGVMEDSRLMRGAVRNCEVKECVLVGSSFEGMVVKYGVFRYGRLVGKIRGKNVLVMRKATGEDVSHAYGGRRQLEERSLEGWMGMAPDSDSEVDTDNEYVSQDEGGGNVNVHFDGRRGRTVIQQDGFTMVLREGTYTGLNFPQVNFPVPHIPNVHEWDFPESNVREEPVPPEVTARLNNPENIPQEDRPLQDVYDDPPPPYSENP
ncbi:hypothetical protein P170DRAFT_508997 [Aspergillus steynii IBT 23096]|uniref:Uncharacterized protein n=1 Tax=Aspergillus steynii IBT 23096 TaxID=1392250 RepID=A0A2I2GDF2_9EURO|nr:uncharacterized protein P170DRAFT_508997 [Aspergillus steynii IBT 23096]PLB50936.1 hypothetical protein P170DRAFT_508997 [Aspergillus steynii IBT 23096]